MKTTINITITRYEGDPFPEAEFYDEFIVSRVASAYPDAEINVSYGSDNRALVNGTFDDGLVDDVKYGAWDDFCDHGYRNYTDQAAAK